MEEVRQNIWIKTRRYSDVRLQPNIDDLICAGMSSGPVKIATWQRQITTNKIEKDKLTKEERKR